MQTEVTAKHLPTTTARKVYEVELAEAVIIMTLFKDDLMMIAGTLGGTVHITATTVVNTICEVEMVEAGTVTTFKGVTNMEKGILEVDILMVEDGTTQGVDTKLDEDTTN